MKYENLFKIHIPEPCHEDWNKMTPNEQGAFCKVCSKTVVDFSDKSEGDVQKFLQDNLDKKICGRFRITQLENKNEEVSKLKIELEKPKFDFPGYLMPVITPFRATALALMLFGAVAVSGCGNSGGFSGGDNKRLAGAVEIIDSTQMINNRIQGGISIDDAKRINNLNNNVQDSTCKYTDDDTRTVGKIKVNYNTDTLKVDTTEVRMLGEIQPVKTHGMINKRQIEQEEHLKGDVKIEKDEK